MREMVYSEAEYSIVMKKMDDYAEFLDECIKEYIDILDFLMEKALEDDAIKAKILKLKGNISLYPSQIQTIQEEMRSCFNVFADRMEEADAIVLPEKEVSFFEAVLQMFK